LGQRETIGQKLRFEVFKRDGFTCQYCGGHPPLVSLEVDHVDPVAKGGTNAIDNLITSCEECNRGKGDRLALERYSPVLKWVPWERALRPPAGLKDYQQAWFWNLLCASFDQQNMQGYLPIRSQTWKLAGAHRQQMWDSHKAAVMAAFDVRKLEDGTTVLFYPPLIELLQYQVQRLRTKKGAGSPLISTVRAGTSTSPSQIDFDFELQHQGKSVPTEGDAYERKPVSKIDERKYRNQEASDRSTAKVAEYLERVGAGQKAGPGRVVAGALAAKARSVSGD